MTNTTTTHNEMVDHLIKQEATNCKALSLAFTVITCDGDIAKPRSLLDMAVGFLLQDGHEVSLDRVRTIAAMRCIGFDVNEAFESIARHPDFELVGHCLELVDGRMEPVDSNGEVVNFLEEVAI